MRTCRIVAFTLTLAALAAPAISHATYVWWETDSQGATLTRATHVFRACFTLAGGVPFVFETDNLTANADTVIHLYNYSNPQTDLVYDDDYCHLVMFPTPHTVCERRSRITFTPSGTGTYCAIVHAASDAMGGNGTGELFDFYVTVNGGTRTRYPNPDTVAFPDGRWPLGGYWLPAALPGLAQAETVETVLVNNGAPNTLLMRFDVGSMQFKAIDETSGIGVASLLHGGGGDANIVVGTSYWYGQSNSGVRLGPVRVMRNDAALNGHDTDGDGLGNLLEADLGTCATNSGILPSGFNCATQACALGMDTDCDGLRDDWEARGTETPSILNLFPLWGASPAHKDIFVEVDRENYTGQLAPDFSQDDANWVAARMKPPFLSGITNPDGHDGIAVHFDVDHPCTEGLLDVDGITSICGQFGGAGAVSGAYGCEEQGRRYYARDMRFHWALMLYEDTSGNGSLGYGVLNGGSSCIAPTSAVGGTTTAKYAMLHMLGHNLGLKHWGTDNDGIAERKAVYHSVMNPSFVYSDSASFSAGALSAAPLNPANLRETGYSTADLSFLASAPYSFPRSGANIDWNRDGVYESTDVPVAAHVHAEPMKDDHTGIHQPLRTNAVRAVPSCLTLDYNHSCSHSSDCATQICELGYCCQTPLPTATGLSTAFHQWGEINSCCADGLTYCCSSYFLSYGAQFVFANDGQGDIKYTKTNAIEGNLAFQDYWAPVHSRSNFSFATASEPSSTHLDINSGLQALYVAAADTSGVVHYSRFVSYLPNGFGAWTSLPTAVAGDPNRQVAFQDVSLAAVGGSSGRVYVVGRDSAAGTNEVFWGYLDWAGNFSGWYKATLNGLPIVSAPDVSPSIALGPNGHVYMLLKSPPNAARAGNLRFYACDGSVWSVASDGVDFWLNEPHPDWSTVRGRPAMAFAWHRRGDTYAPLANGALWAWWMADNKRAANATPYPAMRYRWTWGALNASTANLPANIGKWHWSDLGPDGNPLGRDGSESQDQQCVGTPNYGSIGLAVTPTFGGLRAVLRYQANAWCSPGILWVPYADGQADATWPDGHVLGDHDDRTEIQANLCSSIYPGCPSMCSTFIPCAPGYNTASFACNVVPN